MKTRSVLIVEDDPTSLATVQSYLSRLPFFSTPTVCQTAGQALRMLSEQEFDLVLLDMHLPDLTGLDIIQCLPTHSPIVVTSADSTFAADCFDLNVSDYIVKPYTFQRLVRGVNRALKVQFMANSLTDNTAIYLKIGRSIQRFHFDKMDYIEAFGVYSKIWQNGRATIVNEPISALEAHLPSQRFMRIHKSYIVGLGSLDSYSHSTITVGGNKVPLGASYRPKFEGFLQLLSSKEKEEN